MGVLDTANVLLFTCPFCTRPSNSLTWLLSYSEWMHSCCFFFLINFRDLKMGLYLVALQLFICINEFLDFFCFFFLIACSGYIYWKLCRYDKKCHGRGHICVKKR